MSARPNPDVDPPLGGELGCVLEHLAVDRLRTLLTDRRWTDDVFTPDELAEVSSRSDPVTGLAARLAAKRAVLVALHGAARPDPEREDRRALRSVEVLSLDHGAPFIRLGVGRPTHRAIHVSLSHDGGVAAALVGLVPADRDAARSEGVADREGS